MSGLNKKMAPFLRWDHLGPISAQILRKDQIGPSDLAMDIRYLLVGTYMLVTSVLPFQFEVSFQNDFMLAVCFTNNYRAGTWCSCRQ